MSGGGEKCGEGVGGGRRGHVCHRKRVSAGCLACVGYLSSRVYHLHYQTTSMLDLDNKPQDPRSCTLRASENPRILLYRREGVLLAHSDADYSRCILGQTGTSTVCWQSSFIYACSVGSRKHPMRRTSPISSLAYPTVVTRLTAVCSLPTAIYTWSACNRLAT